MNQSASEMIDKRIAELADWRGETLSRMRRLITQADPDVVEEWKWMNPVWSHDGIICTGESKLKEVRYLDIHQDDRIDEKQLAAWIKQAASIPGWDGGSSNSGGVPS